MSTLQIITILLHLTFVKSYYSSRTYAYENKSTHGQTLQFLENDTALLQCNGNHFQYVRWYKDNSLITDSRFNETLAPDHFRLCLNGSLQILHVQRKDVGEYHCEAHANDKHIRHNYLIGVQYSPSVVIKPAENIDVRIGSTLQIICEAQGVPPPRISWRKNGQVIDNHYTGNRLSLQIEISSRNVSGTIECIATNGIGDPAIAETNLRVLYAPEIRAAQNVVYTKIGLRTELECIVTALPIASVQWFHHGVPLAFGTKITRRDTEMHPNNISPANLETKHIVVHKTVQDSDLGLYECRAENDIGFSFAVIDVTGRPKPCIFKINPSVRSLTSHNLVWQTESLSTIMEFKLKFRQLPSGTFTSQNTNVNFKLEWTSLTIPCEISVGPIHITTYTLYGLQAASVYEVVVFARNHFGWSENSKILRFATGGEVEMPNFSTEFVEDVADVEEAINSSVNTQREYRKNVNDVKATKSTAHSGLIYRINVALLFIKLFLYFCVHTIF